MSESGFNLSAESTAEMDVRHDRIRRRLLIATFATGLAILLLPLLIGVWLPDIVTNRVATLATAHSADGHAFRVVQYWNHGDFYNTELHITAPNGKTAISMLDADDYKHWWVNMKIDENARTASVELGFGRVKTAEW